MRAEIISIGDELCRGEVINSNAAWLGAALWDLQVTVQQISTCGDVPGDILACIEKAVVHSDLVLLSGGLGPTLDDLTVDTICELVGTQAIVHEASAVRMHEWIAAHGVQPLENHLRQVRVPAGSVAYGNPVGAAPGFTVAYKGRLILCLPGPPRELKAIFDTHMRAQVQELRRNKGQVEHIARNVFRVFGKGESQVAVALKGLSLDDGASLHYQAHFPEVLVKLVVRNRDREAASRKLDALSKQVYEQLGHLIYSEGQQLLAETVIKMLISRGQTVATAESCTGGLVAKLLTDVAGVSACFGGGAVTYSNAEKIRQLGVSAQLLDTVGAVSEEVVVAMAEGIRERVGADWGIALSGVAGPTGGSEDKPVGTVYIAVAGPNGAQFVKRFFWSGTRDRIRILSAHWALNALRLQMTS